MLHYSCDLTTYITVEMYKFPRSLVEIETELIPLNGRYVKLKVISYQLNWITLAPKYSAG